MCRRFDSAPAPCGLLRQTSEVPRFCRGIFVCAAGSFRSRKPYDAIMRRRTRAMAIIPTVVVVFAATVALLSDRGAASVPQQAAGAATPAAGAKPGASNTGPPEGSVLAPLKLNRGQITVGGT